mgnify:CR=1 FL=1
MPAGQQQQGRKARTSKAGNSKKEKGEALEAEQEEGLESAASYSPVSVDWVAMSKAENEALEALGVEQEEGLESAALVSGGGGEAWKGETPEEDQGEHRCTTSCRHSGFLGQPVVFDGNISWPFLPCVPELSMSNNTTEYTT